MNSRGLRRCWCAAGLSLSLACLTYLPDTYAWGPHGDITRAALRVLPEKERWEAALGEKPLQDLVTFCWMPDNRDQDLGSFYANDYLLFRACPQHALHYSTYVPPQPPGGLPARDAALLCFTRALQALRTETPVNATRQMGPLLHFIEDCGAPPHAYAPEANPWHTPLENWLDARQVDIAGYQPQSLGQTDAEALDHLRERLDALSSSSAARCREALPYVQQWRKDLAPAEIERIRKEAWPTVSPLLLDAALDCARLVADVTYTLFLLGLDEQPDGAAIEGTITAGAIPLSNDKGARIVLLDNSKYPLFGRRSALASCATDYSTLALTAKKPSEEGWTGEYRFHHIPPGTYRVLASRPGSIWKVSKPVRLKTHAMVRVDLALSPTKPPGNIIQNPQATLSYLPPRRPDMANADPPDQWVCINPTTGLWQTQSARLRSKTTYRCGARLKDPTAKVRFRFRDSDLKSKMTELPAGSAEPEGLRYAYEGNKAGDVAVQIETKRPLTDALDCVWVVPEVDETNQGVPTSR